MPRFPFVFHGIYISLLFVHIGTMQAIYVVFVYIATKVQSQLAEHDYPRVIVYFYIYLNNKCIL